MIQIDNVNMVEKGAPQTIQAPVDTTAAHADAAIDSVSKDIQAKIMDAQKQRQELSFNTEISAQEREKRRQKIEQEISDLKRELRLREAEEKKKQQEAEKAIARKEEQQKNTSSESNGRKTAIQSPQSTNNSAPAGNKSSNDGNAEESDLDGQVSEILPNGMHRIISADSATQQFHIVQNAFSKADVAFKVQEAELSQDAARGTNVKEMRQSLREESKKEMQRMDMVHTVIFGDRNNKSMEPAIGINSPSFSNYRANGIYNNNGMISRQNFQSVQLDVTLS